MRHSGQNDHHQRGFVLIAVLLGLATLTALYAVTTLRVVALRTGIATDQKLLTRPSLSGDFLRLAAAWLDTESAIGGDSFHISIGAETYLVHVTDVGGLIDVNTARPELLERVADWVGVDDVQLAKYRAWRQEPNRAQRIEDFLRVSGAGGEITPDMRQVLTVYSGRNGVTKELADEAVLEILGENADAWDTPKSGSNYLVTVEQEDRAFAPGVVHISADGTARILSN